MARYESVVFLAERTVILQYFTECLSRVLNYTQCEVFLAAHNLSNDFHKRYFEKEEPSYMEFTQTKASAMLQSKFDSRFVESVAQGTRSLGFTTYQCAEGINLQLASAVVSRFL